MSDRANEEKTDLTRRDFLRSATAAAGAGMMVSQVSMGQDSAGPEDQLNVALIGAGEQGRSRLMPQCLKIPGIRFQAVCDIWEYSQKFASRTLKAYDQPVTVYEDYQEMLASENDLDAAIVATPDFTHAPITKACLDAGLHVYCEKEMSNTLKGAREIVKAAQESDQLVQIGHQRRTNPRFMHAQKMIQEGNLGRITHVRGQWNRATILNRSTPKKYMMDEEKLKKHGYDSMNHLRNWRWFKKYAGGPMCDLGSHHIDIFNWFLGTPPSAVQATGGLDYWGEKTDREWWDNVLALYEYQTEEGPVRGFYQVANTTSFRGYYTAYMGFQGSLLISEQSQKGYMVREQRAEKQDWVDLAEKSEQMGQEAIELEVGKTKQKTKQGMDVKEAANKPPHQPHLENFFASIRGEQELTCPPEIGYETAVTVLRANEAVRKAKKVQFDESEFKV